MLILLSDCYEELYGNPEIRVALLKLAPINGILMETPLITSSKTGAPKPIALSKASIET